MDDFYEQLKEAHSEKLSGDRDYLRKRKLYGDDIYTLYCIWCNAFKQGKGKENPYLFAQFLWSENITLSFWQRKHIAETYFGYKFTYNYTLNDWEVTRSNI